METGTQDFTLQPLRYAIELLYDVEGLEGRKRVVVVWGGGQSPTCCTFLAEVGVLGCSSSLTNLEFIFFDLSTFVFCT